MALLSVEGTYHDGKVELAEQPEGVEGARVIVTFLVTSGESENGNSVQRDVDREQALKRVLADMESGLNLGGGPYYESREELYEERLKRFGR